MENLEEKTLAEEVIFTGKVIQLKVADVKLPNGEIAKRELINHPGAVAIIPITADKKIVLVEQFRKPLEKSIIEIPAGKMERGEEPVVTAGRELEEETGYKADKLEFLTSFYTAPGFANEILHVYVASELKAVENPLAKDEDEFLNVTEVDLETAKQLMKEKLIYDAKTVYAVQYLELLDLKKQ